MELTFLWLLSIMSYFSSAQYPSPYACFFFNSTEYFHDVCGNTGLSFQFTYL